MVILIQPISANMNGDNMNNHDIDKEVQDKNLTAPRVTIDLIESLITKEQFHVFIGSTFTSCLLTLKNGFTVHGESACASPENFNAELGRKISRSNAVNKIWMLEGYLLREELHEQRMINEQIKASQLKS